MQGTIVDRKLKYLPTLPKKAEILEFMMKQNIHIPSPVPTRPVLSERINLFQVEKEYFVDNLVRGHGHEVLRLPPYH